MIPSPARIGNANANVMMRSGGKSPVRSPIGTPASDATPQANRNRRVKPVTRVYPGYARNSCVTGAYNGAFWRNRSR